MTDGCEQIIPLLPRVADGEATPDEAMRAARHLCDCTACRILLARERRLVAMLEEGLDDPLPVGEDFVQEVMANLPQGPPPPARGRGRSRRRTLKLAGLVGLVFLASLAVGLPGPAGLTSRAVWRLVPTLDLPLADGLADGAMRLGGLLMMVVDRLASGLPLLGDLGPGGVLPAFALLGLALPATLASGGALALAMGGLFRAPQRSV